jgi:caa(3)-type oxidase subunit IV
MSANQVADVRKEVRLYVAVFFAVAILTLANVAIAHTTAHVAAGVTIALAIAAVNAVLVVRFFMHLASEGKVIHMTLAITALFFVVLFLLVILAMANEQGVSLQLPAPPMHELGHHVS